jgi:hypothetical protein
MGFENPRVRFFNRRHRSKSDGGFFCRASFLFPFPYSRPRIVLIKTRLSIVLVMPNAALGASFDKLLYLVTFGY